MVISCVAVSGLGKAVVPVTIVTALFYGVRFWRFNGGGEVFPGIWRLWLGVVRGALGEIGVSFLAVVRFGKGELDRCG